MLTLDQILDSVPGNRAVYTRLHDLLASGDAVAFVGAGASFPLYPLWTGLIERLADEALRRGLADDRQKSHWLRNAGTRPQEMVSQIRRALGDTYCLPLLRDLFERKTGTDGHSYTPSHSALMRMPFPAYVTTNYDPGLLEARRVFRPTAPGAGRTIWDQEFELNRWISREALRDSAGCVLYAHGYYAEPGNIILDAESYRRVYGATPLRRLIENFWLQEHLVFVGFSFNDAVLSRVADEVLEQTVRQGGAAPRHVAILGLPTDEPYTADMRRLYLDSYHAETLLYPVETTPDGHPDHSALGTLLESLTTTSP